MNRGKRGTSYAIRFRAYGQRHYVTLGAAEDGWTPHRADQELQNVLADVRRGIWRPAEPEPIIETPAEEPTFHVLASEWVERRRHEVDARTVENWTWALSCHLLPYFASVKPSGITAAAVEKYKAAKLAERDQLRRALDEWQNTDADKRGPRPPRGLGNEAINRTLKTLAMVLDDAIDFGYVETNAARGRKRRLTASKPRRTWLEVDELRVLLDAAEDHRALLATMALAGLRVSEACALRWRDVDLANGRLRVTDAKTDAGVRSVELTPTLRDELAAAKAGATDAEPDALVFPTRTGTMRDRNNVRSRVLATAVARANRKLAAAGKPPLQDGITNHTLRRTFCALLYEAGASPAYAMQQMGHSSAALALELYSKVMERKRDTGERMDALLRGADWAEAGRSSVESPSAVSVETTGYRV